MKSLIPQVVTDDLFKRELLEEIRKHNLWSEFESRLHDTASPPAQDTASPPVQAPTSPPVQAPTSPQDTTAPPARPIEFEPARPSVEAPRLDWISSVEPTNESFAAPIAGRWPEFRSLIATAARKAGTNNYLFCKLLDDYGVPAHRLWKVRSWLAAYGKKNLRPSIRRFKCRYKS